MSTPCSLMCPSMVRLSLNANIQKLKAVGNEIFCNLEVTILCLLKFLVFNYVVEDGHKFGLLNYLDASLYEHFRVVRETSIKIISFNKSSALKEKLKL